MIFLSINSGLIVDVENMVLIERRAHPAIPFPARLKPTTGDCYLINLELYSSAAEANN